MLHLDVVVSAWICCQTFCKRTGALPSSTAAAAVVAQQQRVLPLPSGTSSWHGALLCVALPDHNCRLIDERQFSVAIAGQLGGGGRGLHAHPQQWQTEQECGIICCSLSHCVVHTASAYHSASKSQCVDDSVIGLSMNSLPGSGRDEVLATISLQDPPPQCRQAMTAPHCRLYVQGSRCHEACRCLGWLSCFRPRRQHPSLHRLRHRRRRHPAGRPVPAS